MSALPVRRIAQHVLFIMIFCALHGCNREAPPKPSGPSGPPEPSAPAATAPDAGDVVADGSDPGDLAVDVRPVPDEPILRPDLMVGSPPPSSAPEPTRLVITELVHGASGPQRKQHEVYVLLTGTTCPERLDIALEPDPKHVKESGERHWVIEDFEMPGGLICRSMVPKERDAEIGGHALSGFDMEPLRVGPLPNPG